MHTGISQHTPVAAMHPFSDHASLSLSLSLTLALYSSRLISSSHLVSSRLIPWSQLSHQVSTVLLPPPFLSKPSCLFLHVCHSILIYYISNFMSALPTRSHVRTTPLSRWYSPLPSHRGDCCQVSEDDPPAVPLWPLRYHRADTTLANVVAGARRKWQERWARRW